MTSRFQRMAVGLVGAIALGLFAWMVWPTPYRYDRIGTVIVRIARVSGEAQMLTRTGWHRLGPNPFADVAMREQRELAAVTGDSLRVDSTRKADSVKYRDSVGAENPIDRFLQQRAKQASAIRR